MKTLIIDDEAANRENLLNLLQTYTPGVQVCASGGSVAEALLLIGQHQPELLLLDIQLHGETGFDLLRQLDNIDFELIFITAHSQYGIQAVKFAALDYLLKPVDIDELKAAVAKAKRAVHERRHNERLEYLISYLKTDSREPTRIALPMFSETRYVELNEIIRCEADNSYTLFFLSGGERLLVSKTLKEYTALLEPHGFSRVHQSHMVNLDYVKSWLREDGGCLLLKDGNRIPVSKTNRDKLREELNSRMA